MVNKLVFYIVSAMLIVFHAGCKEQTILRSFGK